MLFGHPGKRELGLGPCPCGVTQAGGPGRVPVKACDGGRQGGVIGRDQQAFLLVRQQGAIHGGVGGHDGQPGRHGLQNRHVRRLRRRRQQEIGGREQFVDLVESPGRHDPAGQLQPLDLLPDRSPVRRGADQPEAGAGQLPGNRPPGRQQAVQSGARRQVAHGHGQECAFGQVQRGMRFRPQRASGGLRLGRAGRWNRHAVGKVDNARAGIAGGLQFPLGGPGRRHPARRFHALPFDGAAAGGVELPEAVAVTSQSIGPQDHRHARQGADRGRGFVAKLRDVDQVEAIRLGPQPAGQRPQVEPGVPAALRRRRQADHRHVLKEQFRRPGRLPASGEDRGVDAVGGQFGRQVGQDFFRPAQQRPEAPRHDRHPQRLHRPGSSFISDASNVAR